MSVSEGIKSLTTMSIIQGLTAFGLSHNGDQKHTADNLRSRKARDGLTGCRPHSRFKQHPEPFDEFSYVLGLYQYLARTCDLSD